MMLMTGYRRTGKSANRVDDWGDHAEEEGDAVEVSGSEHQRGGDSNKSIDIRALGVSLLIFLLGVERSKVCVLLESGREWCVYIQR